MAQPACAEVVTETPGSGISQTDGHRIPEELEYLVPAPIPLSNYRQRSEEFRKLFKDLPDSEWLIMDFTCALQKDILLHGRLYLSENWLCFHSNVFRGTTLTVSLRDVTAVSREKMARLIPNAIQICSETDKMFFTSFSAREKSYQGIFKLWQNILMDKPLTKPELWQMVRQHYGNDLGLTREDMDNIQVADSTPQTSMAMRVNGEQHAGRQERPSSLRLPQADVLQGGKTSPAGDQPQASPSLLSGTSVSKGGLRSPSSCHRTVDTPLDRNAPERGSKRTEPALDRNGPERSSKRAEPALDRNAPERSSKRADPALDRNAPERSSKRAEPTLDRNAPERSSKRADPALDRNAPERSSKRAEPALDRNAPERSSKRADPALDRNAPERSSKRAEPALDRNGTEKVPKHSEMPLDQNIPERGSKIPEPPQEWTVQERGSKRPELSLDLNDNEDQISAYSSSESAEDDERPCPAQTQGRVFVNRVFHMSAEKMFELLFTDSHFSRRFMEIRKIKGATSTPWQKDISGNMKRTLNYTITINNPLVGKSSTATETQILYRDKHEGHHYLVDAEVYTHEVPYHDYFYTLNRYCIFHSSKRKCHLRIYTDVKYKKQPWGLVKSFITRNSWSGLEEYFQHLEAELLEEEAELAQAGGDGKVSGARRRRRTYSRSGTEHFKASKAYGGEADQHRDRLGGSLDGKVPHKWNISSIVAAMSVILLILTVLNLGLFFKLWAMEDVAQRMYLSTRQRLRERAETSPELGVHQATPHRSKEETRLLKTVLQDSIQLLEQLRNSLVLLQHSFQVHNRTEPVK